MHALSTSMYCLQACLLKYSTVSAFRIYALHGENDKNLGEVEGCALNSHGNYIVNHGKSWKNHRIVFLNFCGNPGCFSAPKTLVNIDG